MYQVASTLFSPFCFFQLLAIFAVLRLWQTAQTNRRWLVVLSVAIAALYLLSLPAVGHVAMGTLEWQNPRLRGKPPVDAIVVLSGSAWPSDDRTDGIQLGSSTIFRVQAAADLYHRIAPVTVITCGGALSNSAGEPSLASAMRGSLLQAGVDGDDVVVEGRSRNTYENAVFGARLCRQRSVKTIALVTDGTHLPRAIGCFQRQGLKVVPAGCDYRATQFRWELYSFLPSHYGVAATDRALHEWIGMVFYKLLGRI